MFFVTVRYVKSLDVIDSLLAEHVEFLRGQYAAGTLLLSGRQIPRVGGALVYQGLSRAELEAELAKDPFAREGAAQYDILEFSPSMAAEGLEKFIES